MAKFALIKNGVVQNIIIADKNFIDTYADNYFTCVEVGENDYVGIGFTYSDGAFAMPMDMNAFIPEDVTIPIE